MSMSVQTSCSTCASIYQLPTADDFTKLAYKYQCYNYVPPTGSNGTNGNPSGNPNGGTTGDNGEEENPLNNNGTTLIQKESKSWVLPVAVSIPSVFALICSGLAIFFCIRRYKNQAETDEGSDSNKAKSYSRRKKKDHLAQQKEMLDEITNPDGPEKDDYRKLQNISEMHVSGFDEVTRIVTQNELLG